MTRTVSYTQELYADICDSMLDYAQTGWTVCGAEDPAVILLSENFREKHPRLAEYTIVRVIDKYVNPSLSETLLEFSNNGMSEEELRLYEEVMEELE